MIKRILLILKTILLAVACFTLLEFIFYLIRWVVTGKGVDANNFPAYFKYMDQITESI